MEEKWKILKVGDRIKGKYQLLRKTTVGGGGPTFVGLSLSNKKPVHIRFFSPSYVSDEKGMENCIQKANEAWYLLPKNILMPQDYGFHEGIPFIVLEVPGVKTLFDFISKRGSIKPKDAKVILDSLLQVLGILHKNGLFHYGINPLSMCSEDGIFGSKSLGILDFGFVQPNGLSYFTLPGKNEKGFTFICSFASPEQVSGKGEVDGRSDLYSAGVIAFWLLTGKIPFEGQTEEEILKKVVEENPVISDNIVEKSGPNLREFFLKALEKNPSNRFQNPDEMREALNSIDFEAVKTKAMIDLSLKGKQKEGSVQRIKTPVVVLKVLEKDVDLLETISSQEVTSPVETAAGISKQEGEKFEEKKKIQKIKVKTDPLIGSLPQTESVGKVQEEDLSKSIKTELMDDEEEMTIGRTEVEKEKGVKSVEFEDFGAQDKKAEVTAKEEHQKHAPPPVPSKEKFTVDSEKPSPSIPVPQEQIDKKEKEGEKIEEENVEERRVELAASGKENERVSEASIIEGIDVVEGEEKVIESEKKKEEVEDISGKPEKKKRMTLWIMVACGAIVLLVISAIVLGKMFGGKEKSRSLKENKAKTMEGIPHKVVESLETKKPAEEETETKLQEENKKVIGSEEKPVPVEEIKKEEKLEKINVKKDIKEIKKGTAQKTAKETGIKKEVKEIEKKQKKKKSKLEFVD